MDQKQWVLGIDGGATKTTAILVATDGTPGTEERVGPSSISSIGVEKVAELVFDLARQCCEKVSCGPEGLFAVGVGLSGAGRAADRVEFHQALIEQSRRQGFPLTTVLVESDWRVALEAAFPTGFGIALIAGTGSVACAKGEDGMLHRVGGFGRLIGDEGSSFAVARDGLSAALRAHEGRGDRTILLEYALQHFGVSTVEDLMRKIYREHVDIASFSSKVIVAEEEHDRLAHSILFRAAAELVDLVRSLVMHIRPKRRVPVALMGGMLEDENAYSIMVRDKLVNTLPQIVIQKPKFPPAYGAAILAFQPFAFPQ